MSRRDTSTDGGRGGARVLLGGMFARVPDQGGPAWVVLEYVLGLLRLGHRVVLVEPVAESDLVPGSASRTRRLSSAPEPETR
jgi:hypothetical protein